MKEAGSTGIAFEIDAPTKSYAQKNEVFALPGVDLALSVSGFCVLLLAAKSAPAALAPEEFLDLNLRTPPAGLTKVSAPGVEAEVIKGAKAGKTVILHPSDQIHEGARVASRTS
jgi:hypothetical protein